MPDHDAGPPLNRTAGVVPDHDAGSPLILAPKTGPRRADATGGAAVVTSLAVLATGVALALAGPGRGQWLFLHKASFVLWFGVMTIHVLAYAPRLPRLLTSRPVQQHAATVLGGRATRWLLLGASLACGVLLAATTLHLTSRWVTTVG